MHQLVITIDNIPPNIFHLLYNSAVETCKRHTGATITLDHSEAIKFDYKEMDLLARKDFIEMMSTATALVSIREYSNKKGK